LVGDLDLCSFLLIIAIYWSAVAGSLSVWFHSGHVKPFHSVFLNTINGSTVSSSFTLIIIIKFSFLILSCLVIHLGGLLFPKCEAFFCILSSMSSTQHRHTWSIFKGGGVRHLCLKNISTEPKKLLPNSQIQQTETVYIANNRVSFYLNYLTPPS